MAVGAGKFTYEVAPGWGKLPTGWEWGQVAGVAVDSQDRVYAFNRSAHPMMVFDREGNLLASWGEGVFRQAHGICIDRDDNLFLIDRDAHVTTKCTLEGRVLMTMGNRDRPSDTGYTEQSRSVKRAAGPFNLPTDLGVSASGELYVSDGYGNARVHKFSARGRLLFSWGEPGNGPGQFNLPHSVWEASDGRVYVADRENHRIQVFTPQGEHLDTWPGFLQPCKIFVDGDDIMYVSELRARVTICSLDGTVLARLGGQGSDTSDLFTAPHGVWTDSYGDLYVAEVLQGRRLQKLIRKV